MRKAARAWIEIDMNNLRHNVNIVRSRLPDRCQIMASVKADAYGHGAVEICRELNQQGIYAFCVASAAEGVVLRKNNIKGEILILGYTYPEQFYLLVRYCLIQSVIDYEYAKTLNRFGKKLIVHIKIDTGMNRLGEPASNIDNIIRIFMCKNLIIDGIYTHFFAQNNDNQLCRDFTQSQLDRFNHVLYIIEEHGFTRPKAHVQSSYGILNCPDLVFDYARVGTALYGTFSSNESIQYDKALRPVLSVKARISIVKTINAGEMVGYGPAYTATRQMKIAVLTIGYGDGIPYRLSCGYGNVLINGQVVPIVGCVCMDQIMIDVTNMNNVKRGDVTVIIGKSGEHEITAREIAEQTGTISNEVLSRLGSRLERYKT